MAFASTYTSMASPFQQMEGQAMQGLYGMGLMGEMKPWEIRNKMQEMQRFRSQAGGIFGRRPFMGDQNYTSFSDGVYSQSFRPPYSGAGQSSSGLSMMNQPYSNWSSMGNVPRFPSGGRY